MNVNFVQHFVRLIRRVSRTASFLRETPQANQWELGLLEARSASFKIKQNLDDISNLMMTVCQVRRLSTKRDFVSGKPAR